MSTFISDHLSAKSQHDGACIPEDKREDRWLAPHWENLRSLLALPPSVPLTKNVMLTKVIIPHKFGREIFERLELMGITAAHLFDSHEGAAADVINGYNYGRKTGYAWDIVVPPPILT
jgi:hypothetical protein